MFSYHRTSRPNDEDIIFRISPGGGTIHVGH